MNREHRDEVGGNRDRVRAAQMNGDRDPLLIEPVQTDGEDANVAIVADVPIGPQTYRAEFVTTRRVVNGEPWPPGSWRLRVDSGWVPMPKAPPPRQGKQDSWEVALVPHVKGALRRSVDERLGGG